MGIISGAMSGLGEGMSTAGRMLGEHTSRSILQEEAAQIMKLRDDRLSEIRKGEIKYEDELRRAPAKRAAEKIDAAQSGFVDDLSGTARQRTAPEMAQAEEAAYRGEGLVHEAMQVRGLEQQRQRDVNTQLDKTADNNRAERSLDLQVKTFDIHAKGAQLDQQIKQFTLDNTKRVEALRKEFTTADPARKDAITEEIQVLTGKDNDKYLPVPLKDEAGNVTGYRIFDTKRGRWMDEGGRGEQPPASGAHWNDTTGDVYVNGKKIGTAKSRDEARALIQGLRKKSEDDTQKKATAEERIRIGERNKRELGTLPPYDIPTP